ncbi:MAG: phosphoribosylanthranilate isomerase [Helicobacteraceae bacterium]|jgi:phosphoribosylanthranilate isomerase|nr:phosphoribosylanthranilate isomerase [Helicobacteraceae bacterium]
MRVKICGITKYEDALCAIEYGASAIGFVFYGKSPRLVAPEKAAEIVWRLPPFAERLGLFVEQTPAEIDTICRVAGLGIAQIQAEASEDFYAAIKTPVLKVVRARSQADLSRFSGEYRLIDAFVDGYGGEGKRLPLEWFQGFAENNKVILAGGLRAETLADLAPFGFYGVDVSSGVESARGVKDRELIKKFLSAAAKLL